MMSADFFFLFSRRGSRNLQLLGLLKENSIIVAFFVYFAFTLKCRSIFE